jgi:cell division protein FtsI (penicillin-binding protein 3)
MGFGGPTGVDLPFEVGGLVRPASQWTKTSIGSVSIGQEISVTPLQVVSMISTIANGGTLYKPHVVQKVQHPDGMTSEIKPSGRRVISQNTAQQLQAMLEGVVTDGTAKNSRIDGYRAAGKTGTAQKIDPATGTYSRSKYVASFAGYAPASNPRLAMVVVVDEPKGLYYGGQVAAPVFKRIAEQVLRSKAVLPDEPDYAPTYKLTPKSTQRVSAPVVQASFVSNDAPAGAWQLGDVIVPDFEGKSLRHVAEESIRLGLRFTSSGSGRVISQYPPTGAQVREGTRLHVVFAAR